jgi:hypothetical protein
VLLVDVEILGRRLLNRLPEDAEIAPAVLLLDRLRRVDPDRPRPVLVLVAGKQQKVFVYVVVPDAPSLEGRAADRPLAVQLLIRSSNVIRTAHHQHLGRDGAEEIAEVVRLI